MHDHRLRERLLWVGIGCNRGVSSALLAYAVQTTLQQHGFALTAIAAVITLDHKAQEGGLVAFCREHHLPLLTLTAATLAAVPVPHPSPHLVAQVGTPSVAEACAIRGCEIWGTGCHRLRVPKTVVRWAQEPGAVTVAIAQARHPLQSV